MVSVFYRCLVCGDGFVERVSLLSHIDSVHKELCRN